MTNNNHKNSRRDFLKLSALAGGGIVIGFNYIGCKADTAPIEVMRAYPSQWVDFDAFIKIGDTGLVTIMSQNPEIGQNVKTSMPMIVAEELDVAWKDVIVEQAPLNTEWYTRQVAGGSQSIRQSWEILRTAGAKVRKILLDAAAAEWESDVAELSVSEGVISHIDGRTIEYGAIASVAAQLQLPEEVELKDPKDFKIIGSSQLNVDMEGILRGEALFGIDYTAKGMVYAAMVRPPAFGQKLVSYDDTKARAITGVTDVIQVGDKIAVIANNTWACIKGTRVIQAEWKQEDTAEDSEYHSRVMMEHLDKKSDEPRRVDGDVEKALSDADRVIEKIYEAPFLPHNCMEPMNFFANVTDEKIEMVGPIQTPQWTENRIAELLGRDKEEITIMMTRMGGGFGRRLYGDFALEAAEISDKIRKPVKLVYTREDDMTAGMYRPASAYKFRVGIKGNEIVAYHLTEAFYNGMMFGDMPSNFPCGAVDNYRVDCHNIESNITTGAWRAPYANFLAFAEQAFLDEVATEMGVDPVQLRLGLLEKAKAKTLDKPYNYDADKFAGVIKLAAEKSNWNNRGNRHLGFCAYYSHNTYVAEVAEVMMVDKEAVIEKIYCAIDCGIVVNPKAALNQVEGGIIDGIGHAMYGEFSFEEGKPQANNFNQFRLIRMSEAPEIEVHFVESLNDPTGLGEPTLPPAGGAIANALHSATGKRFYKQPFIKEIELLG